MINQLTIIVFNRARVFNFILLGLLIMVQGCDVEKNKQSTATHNVTVLEQKITISKLNRQRTLRIYLPENYQKSKEQYPVLYMHDAQNLFDDKTSYAGEWGIDEILNKLAKEKGLSLIVVGIDNGSELRMNELSPWPNEDYGVAEGEQYMDFIVNELKPFIDKTYRTLTDKNNTAIMGSSMGGLISHYAIFEYPNIFTKAAVFSPSFWFSDEVFTFSKSDKLSANSRLYYLVGDKEGENMVADLNKMVDQLVDDGINQQNIFSKVVDEGEHNEQFWAAEFPQAILWLFSKG